MSLEMVKADLETYLNKNAYRISNNDVIEIFEKKKDARLKRVKVRIDDNFKRDTIITFNTDPSKYNFVNLLKFHKNCDYNLIIETVNGKIFCILVELKTTLYDDDLIYDTNKKKRTAKGQIKSTFTYLYMVLKFLDLNPEFRAVVFYMNDRRSKTLSPTEIDPYIQRETDIEEKCWDFDLPNRKVVTIRYKLIRTENDCVFDLSNLISS
jgi:hypothetical protein